jgi:Ca2+-binding RTX toxin-like protein
MPIVITPLAQTPITDTQFDDIFNPQSSTVLVTGATAGAALSFGITGVTPVAGIATKVGTYGTFTLNTATGAYTYTPNDAAIEPLNVPTTNEITFVVTATEIVGGIASTISENFIFKITQAGPTESTGNDALTGGAGNDTFAALAGNDTIDGAGGADTMAGGAGNDTYILIATNTGTTITEALNEGTDLVQSSMSYTLDANVENLELMAKDLVGTGNELANKLTSFAGAGFFNTLIGGAGNDTLLGNLTSVDSLIGGAGDDSYTVGNLGTVITEVTGEGWDVETAIFTGITLGAGVEVLKLDGTVADGIGNSTNNYLLGNASANTLNGAGGADVMAGYAGADTYTVDNIGDIVIENAGEGLDVVNSTVSFTLGANVETLAFVNGAGGGTLAFEATGNTLDNTITGNEFNNVLNGGAGVDSMTGGAGNDFYFVDNIADGVFEALPADGVDLVYSTAAAFTLGANVENLVVWGTTGISGTGNTGNNIIYGQSLNNTLADGTGTDVLVGGRGQDTYNLAVDTTTDTVYVAAGDSLTTGFDIVNAFDATASSADNLNLDSTLLAANVTLNNGTDAGAIQTNSVANGIITFQGAGGVAINAATLVLSDAIAYVQANITGLQTVAFVQGTDTYLFQDGGANINDTLIDLVGVSATSVATAAGAGAVWII